MLSMQEISGNISDQKGFTLVEMILVIAVFGIMITVALQTLNPMEQIKKSNDAKRKADLSQVQKALEIYYQDNGKYPASITWGTPWSPYMPQLPKDPSPSRSYVYISPASSNGQRYYLYANLERGGKDPQACNTGGTACISASTNGVPNSCGGPCNFGLSSADTTPN